VPQGLTAVQTARVVAELHWATTRLFEVLGLWAAEADRPDIAVSMATSSRHLGWHTGDLAELLPDSVLLEGEAQTGPHTDGVAAAVEAIRAIPGSIERLASLTECCFPVSGRGAWASNGLPPTTVMRAWPVYWPSCSPISAVIVTMVRPSSRDCWSTSRWSRKPTVECSRPNRGSSPPVACCPRRLPIDLFWR